MNACSIIAHNWQKVGTTQMFINRGMGKSVGLSIGEWIKCGTFIQWNSISREKEGSTEMSYNLGETSPTLCEVKYVRHRRSRIV